MLIVGTFQRAKGAERGGSRRLGWGSGQFRGSSAQFCLGECACWAKLPLAPLAVKATLINFGRIRNSFFAPHRFIDAERVIRNGQGWSACLTERGLRQPHIRKLILGREGREF